MLETDLGIEYLGEAKLSNGKMLKHAAQIFDGYESEEVQEIKRLVNDEQWTRDFGDRLTELVLIGANLDKQRMLNALND